MTLVTQLAGITLFAALIGSSAAPPQQAPAAQPTSATMPTMPNAEQLQQMIARFAPVDIGADVSALPPPEQAALAKMVEAARLMDGLFLQQVWAGNTSLLVQLAGDRTPLGQARLHYSLINKGPWSRLDHDAPFIPGVPAKPETANFYPEDATKEEIETWIDTLPEAGQRAANGFFHVIRRSPDGRLVTVPYSQEYQNTLVQAAALLREAAALTMQPTLKKYLDARAAAFLTNDYYASDVAWMELDASIEPTIGPYEVYEDEWFNYKAAFEAFITLRDDAETKKQAVFGQNLQTLEDNLPFDPKYRNPKLGALAPIRVVNVVFTAGDANRGVQTAAFNLPNDDRVVREKGSKRVMLKNVQEAKFQRVLLPIAKVALSPADQAKVSFDAFFTHILMHEMLHGLGPHTVHGTQTPLRQALKEHYSAIEEAKADIAGLWALERLASEKAIDPAIGENMYVTFLASMFRSIRFGVNEAHGRGIAMQLNWMLDNGAITVRADGTFAIDEAKIKDAVATLTGEFLTIEAEGNYDKAADFVKRLGIVRPDVQRVLDKLKDVPVDIEPRYATAAALSVAK
ncbi:MAG: hypothetical protein H0X44_01090 [Acidobacteria bacterium]|nr:hypothetical protein [Acidobacteriota bacterium]